MKFVYADNGSYTIDTGTFVFGPYGPDECGEPHPSGLLCKHMKGHVGCHATYDNDTPIEMKFKYRW